MPNATNTVNGPIVLNPTETGGFTYGTTGAGTGVLTFNPLNPISGGVSVLNITSNNPDGSTYTQSTPINNNGPTQITVPYGVSGQSSAGQITITLTPIQSANIPLPEGGILSTIGALSNLSGTIKAASQLSTAIQMSDQLNLTPFMVTFSDAGDNGQNTTSVPTFAAIGEGLDLYVDPSSTGFGVTSNVNSPASVTDIPPDIVYEGRSVANSDGSTTYNAQSVNASTGDQTATQNTTVTQSDGFSEAINGQSPPTSVSDSQITLRGSDAPTASFNGTDNTISQGNNSGSTTYLAGTGNHVTDDSGNDAANVVGTGSQAFIDGDAVGNMLGSSEQINSTGVGFTGVAADNTNGDNFFGNATTVYIGSATTGALAYGNSNTVSDADNTGSNFNVYGQNLTVGGVSGNNQLGLSGSNTEAAVYGNGLVISTISDQTLHEMSSGGTVEVANDVTGDVIYADHTTIYENQSDNIKVEGNYDQIYGNSTDTNTGDQEGYTGANGYGSSGDDGSSGDGGDGGGGGGYSPPPYDPPPYEGGGGDYGGGGGYDSPDLAVGASDLKANAAKSLNSIAAYDKAVGDTVDEARATIGFAQAELALSLTGANGADTTAAVTGVAWQPTPAADGSRVVTWSFAEGAISAADPFSSFIGNQYQATIEKALQAWSNATGLTFQQVADTSSSNIRIGFSDFGTATTGVLGFTDTQSTASTGTIQSAVVRLEDPLETALSSLGVNGTYAGTGATLYQVALHEIGRALGFSDNADPNSVMYATSSTSNQTLDATDLAGAQLVYGSAAAVTAETNAALAAMPQGGSASGTSTPSTAATPPQTIGSVSTATPDAQSGVNQLVQAMATFSPQESASALGPIAAQNTALATQLAAPLHH